MKKLLFAALLLGGFATSLVSQVVVDGIDINNLKEVRMVRMIVQERAFSNRVNVFIDYGQDLRGAPRQRMEVVEPRTDRRVRFNSVMHAVNFMIDNGWEYVESMVLPNEGINTATADVQYLFQRSSD